MKTLTKALSALLPVLLLSGCAASAPPEEASAAPAPAIVATAAPFPGEPAPEKADGTILFINVGKADAALVQAGGKNYLIDTGTKESVVALLAALDYMGVERLDGVFLTHTHGDHIGGMEALGRCLPVERLYAAVYSENKKNGENKITLLADALSLPLTRLAAGEQVIVGDGIRFDVLGPLVYNGDDDNDNSLVLRLTVGDQRALFTGDMQFAQEATLLGGGIDLAASVLKVGNHGNPDATSDKFAKAVSPALAVISTDTSVDEDSANPRVLAALQGARIWITEDADKGVLVAFRDGALSQSALSLPKGSLSLSILAVDKAAQLVTIGNRGSETADLSGCMLYSEKGDELFRFPSGSVLSPGETLSVSGAGGGGDYAFAAEAKPWNQKKADPAYLFDRFGNLLSQLG